ncbi:MAG: ATP-dependent 6-phosphofructokinase [Candidatus Caldatribacteriota bacterium]|nr:ATP-dependent 6-phosphofructokinase [Candidatus Caldatribacteriota bacterium]
MIKRIGILTGGGDCCGLNQTIRGAVYRAKDFNYEIFGIHDGWKGLVEGLISPITLTDVEELVDKAGTFLGSSRTNPYKIKDGVKNVLRIQKNYGLDAIIAMGGEDTLGVANRLFKEEKVNIVGAPKTMDNDLSGTDYTFGFDSSVTRAVEAMRSLEDTGRSHHRVMVLEVMGRHAGWVALFTGIACGADWTLIPEYKTDIDEMCKQIQRVYARKKYALIVTSEGANLQGGAEKKEELDQFGHMILKEREVGKQLKELISEKTGLEARHAVIGHMQRGGIPTVFDRILGLRCGVTAIDLIAQGKFGYMAALKGNKVIGVPLEEAVGKLKTIDAKWWKFAQVFFK